MEGSLYPGDLLCAWHIGDNQEMMNEWKMKERLVKKRKNTLVTCLLCLLQLPSAAASMPLGYPQAQSLTPEAPWANICRYFVLQSAYR